MNKETNNLEEIRLKRNQCERISSKKLYHYRLDNKLCADCGDKLPKNDKHKTCKKCRDKRNEVRHKRESKRYKKGICVQCGKNKTQIGYLKCDPCRTIDNARKRNRRAEIKMLSLIDDYEL